MDLPATQQGHRIHAWGGELRWESYSRPAPDPGEVLVAVEACGVGLTTLNCIRGDLADTDDSLPLVPGHEFVGTVVATGDASGGHLLGRRVAAYFDLSCGRCRACDAGWDQRCSALAGLVGVHRDGGYAPFATLPVRNAIVMPDGLDPVTATLVPDAIATPVHVCRERARLTVGDRTVVIGAGGGVGAHLVQVARLLGSEVIGVDTAEDKLAALEEFGVRCMTAAHLAAAAPSSLFAGGAPTAVIDLVGSEQTLRYGHDALGMGGRLVLVTTFRDRRLVADPRELVFREASIIASRYARRSEVADAAELLLRGDVAPVIGARSAARDVEDVHDLLRGGALLGRGAMVWETA